ncbi:hypothetical protein C0J45_11717 [Silurus meridionalis]|nr:hypothetical protein C0J45_11717 [Silurus meridionalis]
MLGERERIGCTSTGDSDSARTHFCAHTRTHAYHTRALEISISALRQKKKKEEEEKKDREDLKLISSRRGFIQEAHAATQEDPREVPLCPSVRPGGHRNLLVPSGSKMMLVILLLLGLTVHGCFCMARSPSKPQCHVQVDVSDRSCLKGQGSPAEGRGELVGKRQRDTEGPMAMGFSGHSQDLGADYDRD